MEITLNFEKDLPIDANAHVGFMLTPDTLCKMLSHEASLVHVLTIGLENILKDSFAPVGRDGFKTEEEWRQAQRDRASLKLGALVAGETRMNAAKKRDSVNLFTMLARRFILSKLGSAKRKELAAMPDKGVAFIDAVWQKNAEKYTEQVNELVRLEEERRKVADQVADDLDLDI